MTHVNLILEDHECLNLLKPKDAKHNPWSLCSRSKIEVGYPTNPSSHYLTLVKVFRNYQTKEKKTFFIRDYGRQWDPEASKWDALIMDIGYGDISPIIDYIKTTFYEPVYIDIENKLLYANPQRFKFKDWKFSSDPPHINCIRVR